MEIPAHYTLAFSEEQIQTRLQALGEEIGTWAKDAEQRTGSQILAVCILRGGALFYSDLIRAIPTSTEMAFCRAWSYSSESNTQGKGVKVAIDDVEAQGRAILMIDDICDTGATLQRLEKVFGELGAAEVRSAVCIHRSVPKPLFAPSWSAFPFGGDEWFVGYGMEDKNHYSNLRGIYTISPS